MSDLHAGNIGRKDGNLVHFDIMCDEYTGDGVLDLISKKGV